MGLSAGTKLGPYEIDCPLGAGGMGEVYRARDTRLNRDVAIKVLPSHLSSDSDLKLRFEREARAISSLQHPHICTLHDIGHQDGIDYLVMEFLEGETLERRLLRGSLRVKQAVEYGIEIAEALERAHQAGIVHRDLKPGNIMLTKSGAKLLDFGLAKPIAALSAAASGGPITPGTPTMSIPSMTAQAGPLTQQGTVVGTFQYVAPEVLQGRDADARKRCIRAGRGAVRDADREACVRGQKPVEHHDGDPGKGAGKDCVGSGAVGACGAYLSREGTVGAVAERS